MAEIDTRLVRLVHFETGEYFDLPFGPLCVFWDADDPQSVRSFLSPLQQNNPPVLADSRTFEAARVYFADFIAQQMAGET